MLESARERGEREANAKKKKEKKKGGRRPKSIWGPHEKGGDLGLGLALLPCRKFTHFRNQQASSSGSSICMEGEGNSPTTKGGIMVLGHCPPCLTRGGRGIMW